MKLSSKIFFAVGLAGALTLVFPRAARADAIVVFDVSGELTDGSSFSGTVTIDTTDGDVTAADLSLGAPDDLGPFTLDYQTTYNTDDYELTFEDPSSDFIAIELPVKSLVGYPGTPICVSGAQCRYIDQGVNSGVDFFTGSGAGFDSGAALTESVAAAPEPSSTVPLIAGVLGLVAGIRRNRGRSSDGQIMPQQAVSRKI